MWNLKRVRIVGIAATIGLAACGSSSTGPSPESLVGTWNATQAQLVSQVNQQHKIDLVAMGTVVLVLNSDGTFTLTITMQGQPPDQRGGRWTSSDILTLTFTSGWSGDWQFDMNLNGDTLTLTGAHTDYDYGNGPEDSRVNLVMARQ